MESPWGNKSIHTSAILLPAQKRILTSIAIPAPTGFSEISQVLQGCDTYKPGTFQSSCAPSSHMGLDSGKCWATVRPTGPVSDTASDNVVPDRLRGTVPLTQRGFVPVLIVTATSSHELQASSI